MFTLAMVNIEVLYPKLRKIGWQRFNFPWCAGYHPKSYHRDLDLRIHKDRNNFRPHRLRPILLFEIEANIHNKHLGKLAIKIAE